MSGKISVGVRRTTTGVKSKIKSAITMNVYGLRNASATIHIDDFLDPYRDLRIRDFGVPLVYKR